MMWYVLLAREQGNSFNICGFFVSLAEAKKKAKILWENSDVKEIYIARTIEKCQIKREVTAHWTKETE